MILAKPYRARAVLVTLVVAIGCVWFLSSDEEPRTSGTGLSSPIKGETSASPIETLTAAPVSIEAKVPSGGRLVGAAAGGQLAGRIVDTDGQGIAGIKVSLRTLRRSDRGFF